MSKPQEPLQPAVPSGRSLRPRYHADHVMDYVNIDAVDISSRLWGLVRRGVDGLTLTRNVNEIREWVQELVEQDHATLNTFTSFEVGDCDHTTLKTDRSKEFMGFIAVDVHHTDSIVQELKAPSLGNVHSCTVLINDSRVVSTRHADMDAGLTFVVKGEKIFRVLTSDKTRTTSTSPDIWPSSNSDPPRHWHDIVVQAGDVIAVPPNRPHCVMSCPDTIAVSLTFKQAGVKAARLQRQVDVAKPPVAVLPTVQQPSPVFVSALTTMMSSSAGAIEDVGGTGRPSITSTSVTPSRPTLPRSKKILIPKKVILQIYPLNCL